MLHKDKVHTNPKEKWEISRTTKKIKKTKGYRYSKSRFYEESGI
jgi:hypothetical protein